MFFIRQRLFDIDLKTFGLASFPDLKAAQWISENIVDDKKIYINNFPAYNDTVFVGSDAGWWLPYLTKKQVNVPPLNYGFELDKQIKNELIDTAFMFWNNGIASEAALNELQKEGIGYLFIGQKQGSVNSPELYRLDVSDLDNSGNFGLIYQEDYIRLYSLLK